MEAKWSQSPVLPWARRAYETCLSAGSTAIAAKSNGALTRNSRSADRFIRAQINLRVCGGFHSGAL